MPPKSPKLEGLFFKTGIFISRNRLSETRTPIPPQVGQSEKYDYEYKREGTCNLFVFFQPLAGWRHIKVTKQRTAIDFAHCMKELVDVLFPLATLIRVVLDNLNTHTPASLYQAFPPEEARRILSRLEFHYIYSQTRKLAQYGGN